MKQNDFYFSKMNKFFFSMLVLTVSIAMLFSCRHHNDGAGGAGQITVTVAGDAHVIVNNPKSFPVAKGSQWSTIKNNVKVSFKDNYELSGWKVGDENGSTITDATVFTGNTTVFAVSKQKNTSNPGESGEQPKPENPAPESPKPVEITITVKGDTNVETIKPESLTATKDAVWSDVKGKITVTYKAGYENLSWKLGDANGADITDSTVFSSNTTVFAVSKKANERIYKVKHLQQNVSGNEYTLKEEETKSGEIDADTAAAAKTYEGFGTQPVTQQKIKADNSTVVEIKYDRKIITLNFDLKDGNTVTPLDGNTLKGRFEAPVTIADPSKDGYQFKGWDPELPKTFTLEADGKKYTANWAKPTLTIQADERLVVTDPSTMEISFNATWASIKAEVNGKVSLKTDWPTEYYELYQWRLGSATGALITDDYTFTQDTTVYAVSNYKKEKFNIEGTTLKGHKGQEPKGVIYIPEGITIIAYEAFNAFDNLTGVIIPKGVTSIGEGAFQACSNLAHVSLPSTLITIGVRAFNSCEKLSTITVPLSVTSLGAHAFSECTSLKTVDMQGNISKIEESSFSNCTTLTSITIPDSVTSIGDYAFVGCTALGAITVPNKVSSIKTNVFSGCTSAVISLPKSIAEIGETAFGQNEGTYCKKVKVKNDDVKQRVINPPCSYPAEKVETY